MDGAIKGERSRQELEHRQGFGPMLLLSMSVPQYVGRRSVSNLIAVSVIASPPPGAMRELTVS